MISKEQASDLHDRATRGQSLSAEERRALDAWYDAQDKEEATQLSGRNSPQDTSAALNQAIAAASVRIRRAEDRIQALARENAALRQEITDLQQRLPSPAAGRPA